MKKVLIIFCALLVLTGCQTKEEKDFYDLENSFISDVTTYYNNNIVGQQYPPFSCERITISDMDLSGMDVSKYVDASCNTTDVAAFVVVTDSSDPANIKFNVVPNLNCDGKTSTITSEQKASNQCISTYLSK